LFIFNSSGHGDCWVNNFLYHYKKGNLPDKIVLIDWQISRYCSPVTDLAYFIFACTDRQLRKNHFDELLSIYYHSLKELLDHLGGDSVSQFPYTAFLRHMKKYAKFGIIMSTFIVPMLQTKKEDIPDMDFIAENVGTNDPEIMNAFMTSLRKEADVVGKRMREVIQDAIQYGYL
jgi:Ecdysteroid kinase-like family